MVDLTDAELGAELETAEKRARIILATEPRAASPRYDANSGQIVVKLRLRHRGLKRLVEKVVPI